MRLRLDLSRKKRDLLYISVELGVSKNKSRDRLVSGVRNTEARLIFASEKDLTLKVDKNTCSSSLVNVSRCSRAKKNTTAVANASLQHWIIIEQ